MRLVSHKIWIAIAAAITQLLIDCSDCWNPLLWDPLTLAQTSCSCGPQPKERKTPASVAGILQSQMQTLEFALCSGSLLRELGVLPRHVRVVMPCHEVRDTKHMPKSWSHFGNAAAKENPSFQPAYNIKRHARRKTLGGRQKEKERDRKMGAYCHDRWTWMHHQRAQGQ